MSYCRFSSDNFGCDLYVYEDCMGGWTTHTASSRFVGDIPKLPSLTEVDNDTYMDAYRAQLKFLETAERVHIDLEFVGARFNDDTAAECAVTIQRLKDMGYRVPQSVIEALRQEEEEEEDE